MAKVPRKQTDTCLNMWPETPLDLIRVQRKLASRRPAPWHASGPQPLLAGCSVCAVVFVELAAIRRARLPEPLRRARREGRRARAAEQGDLR